MKRFCAAYDPIYINVVLTFPPLTRGCSEGLGAFRFLFKQEGLGALICFYFYLTEFSHNKLMPKIQPVVIGRKTPSSGRRERTTYDVLSIQRESGNDTKNTRKKRHLQINKRKK